MKTTNKLPPNYLENIPVRKITDWETGDDGNITLLIQNKGVFNFIAQKLFKKPKVSQVHLDENGSFVWSIIDGERNISELADDVDKKFGEAAHPLYERLAKFFQILESYGFVEFKKK